MILNFTIEGSEYREETKGCLEARQISCRKIFLTTEFFKDDIFYVSGASVKSWKKILKQFSKAL
jgi:hypothetical protein